MIPGLQRLAVGSVFVAVAGAGLAACAGDDDPSAGGDAAECLIVDTDVGLDDYRAFAALVPARDLRAVVVTEGISSVAGGASAIAMFLAAGDEAPPVIPGSTSSAPPEYDWLAEARNGSERINNFLHDVVPFAGDPGAMTGALLAVVDGCSTVDVLVLGPWTSFLDYAPALGDMVRHVTVSGRPYAENSPDNFNCAYDVAACKAADTALAAARDVVWIDLPPTQGDDMTYAASMQIVDRFDSAGLPGLLRAALKLTPAAWEGWTRLWDDAAAIYVLSPEKFASQGGHVEPVVDEGAFGDMLVHAVNTEHPVRDDDS